MKTYLPYIGGLILAVALGLLLFSKKPREFDGTITLNNRDKNPYGTFAAYQMLQQQFRTAKFVTNRTAPGLSDELSYDSSGQLLIILDNYFNPSEPELSNLTAFAQQGNTVLISAAQMNDLSQKFFHCQEEGYYSENLKHMQNVQDYIGLQDSFTIVLDSKTFRPPLEFSYPGIDFSNHFISTDSLYTYILGSERDGTPNLLGINTQKGTVFLHSTPIAFTNFFLLYNNNQTYLEQLASLVKSPVKKVIWDEYFINKSEDNSSNEPNGILSVILKYENFKWAFWLSLAALGLFIISGIQRKQRLIPEYKKPSNESLEFVKTIGTLYFEKGDHKNLADKLTSYFLDHVRRHYKVDTHRVNSEFAKQLSKKTNVPEEEIMQIVTEIQNTQLNSQISAEHLIHFYQLLENFYKKA